MPLALQYPADGEPKTVISVAEVPKPKLENDHQVLIRVRAAPMHPVDLYAIAGNLPFMKPAKYPAIPGMEGAGVVEEIGSGVSTVKVGQRVHFRTLGAYQDFVVVDSKTSMIIPVPDSVTFEEASQLTLNPLTATGCLHFSEIPYGKGAFLLLTQASSSLGRYIVQLGKLKGFKTISVVRRAEQVAELKALGSDFVLDSTTDDIVAKVKEITGGAGVKHAIDFIGGDLGALVIQSLGFRAVLVLGGGFAHKDTPMNPLMVLQRQITIKGFNCLGYEELFPENVKADCADLVDFLATKKLTLDFKSFAPKDFNAAVDHNKSTGKTEKTILVFNQ